MPRLEMKFLVIAKRALAKEDVALCETQVERASEQQHHYHKLAQKHKKVNKTRDQVKISIPLRRQSIR
ncbi:hypothetical protein CCR75_006596 [Bremia lactucae]|uniref:Uncharacterized protein n=1 Tax=Bremia lactucae TaxID=4779 RepID=A0A976FRR1_BRELC|nr:hypothetical protein CCR75_006596 [Bremia lactucae]